MKVAYEARLDMRVDRVVALTADEESLYEALTDEQRTRWLEGVVTEDAIRMAESGGDTVEVHSLVWKVLDVG